jgi:hypothetical protein
MTVRQAADRAVAAMFVAGLAGYAAASLLRPPDAASLAREKRRPAPAPAVSASAAAVKALPGKFEQFFNDRLAFREPLLELYARIKIDELEVSSSDKVILGRDGWLFADEAKLASRGSRTADDQVRLWTAALRQRRDWCAARGVEYLVLPTPEKHTIYPEFLPAALQHPRPPTPAERLAAALPAAGVRVIDVYGPLRRAKADGPVYFRDDTHWNHAGGYAAYRATAAALGETPLGADDFPTGPAEHRGDLRLMLHQPGEHVERFTAMSPRRQRARPAVESVAVDPVLHGAAQVPMEVWTGPGRRRVVVLHDSFAPILFTPALAEHCETLVAVSTYSFLPAVIERFKPDAVIQQAVERTLNGTTPYNPAGFGP